MVEGIHWEWRGFGAVSSEFSYWFGKLEPLILPQDVEDVYLWIPGLEVNVKVRDIPEEPFKFKRLLDKDGYLEQWAESPKDIFRFPLDEAGWDVLVEAFASVNVILGPCPLGGADAETTLSRLRRAGGRVVAVNKARESRLWKGAHGPVKVECACISSPQAITSIGLETWDEDPEGQGLSDEQAKEDIRTAIKESGLGSEPLTAMSYLEAVAVWASGAKI